MKSLKNLTLAWRAAGHYFGQEARWEKPSTSKMGNTSIASSLVGMWFAGWLEESTFGFVAFATVGATAPWIYYALVQFTLNFSRMLKFVRQVNGYATRLASLQEDPVDIPNCWIGERFGEPHPRLWGLVVFNPDYGKTHSTGDRSNPALKFVLEQCPAFRQMLNKLVRQLDQAVVSKDASAELADSVNRLPEDRDDLVAAGEAARAMPDDRAWEYFFQRARLEDLEKWRQRAETLLLAAVCTAEDRFNARMFVESVKTLQPQALGMEAETFGSRIATLLCVANLEELEEVQSERDKARGEYEKAVQPPGEEADTPEKTAKHALMSLPQAD